MPDPGQRHAPSFSGDPDLLERFFDEVERYAANASLDDSAKVQYARRYVTDSEYRTWSRLAKVYANDWTTFKNAAYDEYPGSRPSEFADLAQLEELVEEYRNKITTIAQLGKSTLNSLRCTTRAPAVESEPDATSKIRTAVQEAMAEFASQLSQQTASTPVAPAPTQYLITMHTAPTSPVSSTPSRSIGPALTASPATLKPTSSSGLSNEINVANETQLLGNDISIRTRSTAIPQESVSTQELQHQSNSEYPEIVDNRQAQQAPIQLTLEELMSISPGIRKELCERLQAMQVPVEASSEHGTTTYHEPPPPQVPPDDDDYDYEAAIKALYQMDNEDPPTPPDDDNDNDYGTAIADLYQMDDNTPPPPRIALLLHNATAIARPSETLGMQHEVHRRPHSEGIGTQLEEIDEELDHSG
ncbi:hypothetical protein EYR40_011080 [Pleurotus pulmonarius]|nr:hypothetical protein EYR40_011080 [Pleurotus pulmonarius]